MSYENIFDLLTSTIWLFAGLDYVYAKHKNRGNYKRPFMIAMWNIWLCVGGILWWKSEYNTLATTVLMNLAIIQIISMGEEFKFKKSEKSETVTDAK